MTSQDGASAQYRRNWAMLSALLTYGKMGAIIAVDDEARLRTFLSGIRGELTRIDSVFAPPPETRFLLLEVNDSFNEGWLDDMDGVVSYEGHPSGCCCKNCPWNGKHK